MIAYKYFIASILLIFLFYIIYNIATYKPTYNEGNKVISKDPKHKPNKLLVTAHPDDETLWGYKYIKDDPQSWKILCITCATDKIRVSEFKKVMEKLEIKNYEIWDHDNSIFAKELDENCFRDIKKDIDNNKYCLIITHNHYGEYGNLQHMSLHKALTRLKNDFNLPINFFKFGKYTKSYEKNKLLKNYNSQSIIIVILKYWSSFF